MCWIDNHSENEIYLKYLILETPYTFLSIFSWHFSFMCTEHSITCVFKYEQKQPFLVLLKEYKENNVTFLLYFFTAFKKKMLLNIFNIDLILF